MMEENCPYEWIQPIGFTSHFQVKTGDTVIKIDGQAVKNLSKSERSNLLGKSGKRPLKMTLQRGDGEGEFIEIDVEQESAVQGATDLNDLGRGGTG